MDLSLSSTYTTAESTPSTTCTPAESTPAGMYSYTVQNRALADQTLGK